MDEEPRTVDDPKYKTAARAITADFGEEGDPLAWCIQADGRLQVILPSGKKVYGTVLIPKPAPAPAPVAAPTPATPALAGGAREAAGAKPAATPAKAAGAKKKGK